MFVFGVPEKVIAEFTGHKSSKALQKYERSTADTRVGNFKPEGICGSG